MARFPWHDPQNCFADTDYLPKRSLLQKSKVYFRSRLKQGADRHHSHLLLSLCLLSWQTKTKETRIQRARLGCIFAVIQIRRATECIRHLQYYAVFRRRMSLVLNTAQAWCSERVFRRCFRRWLKTLIKKKVEDTREATAIIPFLDRVFCTPKIRILKYCLGAWRLALAEQLANAMFDRARCFVLVKTLHKTLKFWRAIAGWQCASRHRCAASLTYCAERVVSKRATLLLHTFRQWCLMGKRGTKLKAAREKAVFHWASCLSSKVFCRWRGAVVRTKRVSRDAWIFAASKATVTVADAIQAWRQYVRFVEVRCQAADSVRNNRIRKVLNRWSKTCLFNRNAKKLMQKQIHSLLWRAARSWKQQADKLCAKRKKDRVLSEAVCTIRIQRWLLQWVMEQRWRRKMHLADNWSVLNPQTRLLLSGSLAAWGKFVNVRSIGATTVPQVIGRNWRKRIFIDWLSLARARDTWRASLAHKAMRLWILFVKKTIHEGDPHLQFSDRHG